MQIAKWRHSFCLSLISPSLSSIHLYVHRGNREKGNIIQMNWEEADNYQDVYDNDVYAEHRQPNTAVNGWTSVNALI